MLMRNPSWTFCWSVLEIFVVRVGWTFGWTLTSPLDNPCEVRSARYLLPGAAYWYAVELSVELFGHACHHLTSPLQSTVRSSFYSLAIARGILSSFRSLACSPGRYLYLPKRLVLLLWQQSTFIWCGWFPFLARAALLLLRALLRTSSHIGASLCWCAIHGLRSPSCATSTYLDHLFSEPHNARA